MRTIQVSGGYSGTLSGKFTDDFNGDLSGATVKVKLVPSVTSARPGINDVDWLTPALDTSSLGTIVWHITVNETNAPPNDYKVYGMLNFTGVIELLLADDYVRTV